MFPVTAENFSEKIEFPCGLEQIRDFGQLSDFSRNGMKSIGLNRNPNHSFFRISKMLGLYDGHNLHDAIINQSLYSAPYSPLRELQFRGDFGVRLTAIVLKSRNDCAINSIDHVFIVRKSVAVSIDFDEYRRKIADNSAYRHTRLDSACYVSFMIASFRMGAGS